MTAPEETHRSRTHHHTPCRSTIRSGRMRPGRPLRTQQCVFHVRCFHIFSSNPYTPATHIPHEANLEERDRALGFRGPPPPPTRCTEQTSVDTTIWRCSVKLLRKEVIQPHLPVRLPCYDFVPIASPTFDRSPPCGLGHGLRVLPTFVT